MAAKEEISVKHEKFAQAYVLYRNATEAAKKAGYSSRSAHNQGSRLLKVESIRERIEELEKEMETNIDVIAEIEKQYTYATNNNHTNSALKALEILSRVNTAKEENVPETVEELEGQILSNLEILGEDRVNKLFLKCSWFQEEEEEEEGDEKVESV